VRSSAASAAGARLSGPPTSTGYHHDRLARPAPSRMTRGLHRAQHHSGGPCPPGLLQRHGPGRGLIGHRLPADHVMARMRQKVRTSRLPRKYWSALEPRPSVQPIDFGPATGASDCSDSLADSASNLRNSR
jgi:hypothetical protein